MMLVLACVSLLVCFVALHTGHAQSDKILTADPINFEPVTGYASTYCVVSGVFREKTIRRRASSIFFRFFFVCFPKGWFLAGW
jgi:hypothetical protein